MWNFSRTLFVRKKLTLLDKLIIILQGVVMGFVELIPGVGMSTISLIFGIYHRYINFLHHVSLLFKNFPYTFAKNSNKSKKELLRVFGAIDSDFGVYLFIGVLLGIVVFSKFFSFITYNFPAYTNAILFGVVLASIRLPIRQIKKFNFSHKFILLITFFLFFYIFGLHTKSLNYTPSLLVMFITGILSSLTLLLPGLGGSFIFILFGTYEYVLKLVHDFSLSGDSFRNALPLFVLIFGFIFGFNTLIRITKHFIKYYKDIFMSVLSGIMIASLRLLYPFVGMKGQEKIIIAPADMTGMQVILIIVFVSLSYGLAKVININTKPEDPIEDL